MTGRHSAGEGRGRDALGALGTGIMTGITLLFAGVLLLAVVIPALTGSTALTVRTSSMEPGFPPGTMVVVRPSEFSKIEPGTVITYQLRSGEPTLVTHRVSQRQELADGTVVLVTKGDANPVPDSIPIIEKQVRGTLWYAIPYVGWVTSFFTGQTKSMVTMLVIAALLAYAAWMVVSDVRDRRRRKTGIARPQGRFWE
ncbi:signal peptidase I [Leucobacter insecticola]|uniref:Signal peptidase I n=1 Tax=Leucobacter insecticola TaxID=2714934 RepID=A0A6G8FKC4_9MICO|nr:signal peptidase I [Leucobacter insecticola]QIM16798.1 signal peptidase I [Leucobacter insecticola]